MASTTFKSIVDTTFDSVEGYRKAIEKADSPQLKGALQKRLTEREKTLTKLNEELGHQGDELVSKGTMTGAMHRLWIDVTSLFEKGDEAAAERVEEGEDYLAGKFEEALKDDDLVASERSVLEACLSEIRAGERFGDMLEARHD